MRFKKLSRQYKREYSLTIIGSSSKIIQDLRISFEVTKSSFSYPNLAFIELYNPNEETVSLMTESEPPLIILNAGYQGSLGLLFKGRVRNAFSNKSGTENILTCYAGDGEREWEQATYNKTVAPNLKISDIILELFKSMTELGDVTIGDTEGLDFPADKLRGQSLSGNSRDILDNLANDYNFEWSIQNGEIIYTPVDKPLSSLDSVLIKQSTGMIGSPTVTEIGAEVTTLLNTELSPSRLFTIESESSQLSLGNIQFRELKRTRAEGNYRAYETVFTGDSRGESWYTTAKGTYIR